MLCFCLQHLLKSSVEIPDQVVLKKIFGFQLHNQLVQKLTDPKKFSGFSQNIFFVQAFNFQYNFSV